MGTIYLYTGMRVILISHKWCNLYGTAIKLKYGAINKSTSSKAIYIIGATNFMAILLSKSKVNLRDIALSSGEFYQIFKGMDIMSGLQENIRYTEIPLPGAGVKVNIR